MVSIYEFIGRQHPTPVFQLIKMLSLTHYIIFKSIFFTHCSELCHLNDWSIRGPLRYFFFIIILLCERNRKLFTRIDVCGSNINICVFLVPMIDPYIIENNNIKAVKNLTNAPVSTALTNELAMGTMCTIYVSFDHIRRGKKKTIRTKFDGHRNKSKCEKNTFSVHVWKCELIKFVSFFVLFFFFFIFCTYEYINLCCICWQQYKSMEKPIWRVFFFFSQFEPS